MKRYLLYLAITAFSASLLLTAPTKSKPKVLASTNQPVKKVLAQSEQAPPKAISQPVAKDTPKPTTPTPPPAQAEVAPAPVVYPTDHNTIMAQAGIAESDFGYVDYIVSREGGWCATRWQGMTYCPGYFIQYDSLYDTWEGYGLCQSTPGIKMATAGDDFATNPVTQMKWCNSYALARYGSWYASYIHWVNNHNW